MTTNFFHPSLLLLFLDPGSGMGKNQDPGSGIRDEHPGSGTLVHIDIYVRNIFKILYQSKLCDTTLRIPS
jgi:hypothetical protein